MKRTIPVLASLLFYSQALAEVWTIQGKKIEFQSILGAPIAHCGKRKVPDCNALKILKGTVLEPDGPASRTSGADANPAALLCVGLRGTVVIGTDKKKNENGFCKFSDGSMVSTGALYKAASKGRKAD